MRPQTTAPRSSGPLKYSSSARHGQMNWLSMQSGMRCSVVMPLFLSEWVCDATRIRLRYAKVQFRDLHWPKRLIQEWYTENLKSMSYVIWYESKRESGWAGWILVVFYFFSYILQWWFCIWHSVLVMAARLSLSRWICACNFDFRASLRYGL